MKFHEPLALLSWEHESLLSRGITRTTELIAYRINTLTNRLRSAVSVEEINGLTSINQSFKPI